MDGNVLKILPLDIPLLMMYVAGFIYPLEHANIDSSLVQEEWNDMVKYGKQYLHLVQEDYNMIWWKLFNAVEFQLISLS